MPPKAAGAKKPAAAAKTTKTAPAKAKAAPGKASASKAAPGAAKKTDSKDVTSKLANLSTEDSPKPAVVEIELKDLATVLKDDDGTMKSSKKWPLVVDPSGRASVFLRYQGGNYVDTHSPDSMQPSSLRRVLLGALRYGTQCILDFGDTDMLNIIKDRLEEIHKGLAADILDKSIIEKFAYLIHESDGPDYEESKFGPLITAAFEFIILSKLEASPEQLQQFYVIKIKD
ncbi:IQ motif and ankyrin repeat domain-containing protein 1-like [Diadema setosum]|uniref:IQ motif and ankyrin repeat domain-containing protein 1-like n=1 Tax=Diadema setosum TaxID=31175 RepID=UPI003B3A66F1